MVSKLLKLLVTILMFTAVITSCDNTKKNDHPGRRNISSHKEISEKELKKAIKYTNQDRSRRYAKTFNPLFDNESFEYMLTEDQFVIYRKGNGEWKYAGSAGLRYNTQRSGNRIEIGAVDMIAADGNRVFIKDVNNYYYFAIMEYSDVDPKGQHENKPGFYFVSDPSLFPTKHINEHNEAIKNFGMWGYNLYIPTSWLVPVDDKFTWYRIKPGFSCPKKPHVAVGRDADIDIDTVDTGVDEIVDIAVVSVNNSQGYNDPDNHGYKVKYGGQYHRKLPGHFTTKEIDPFALFEPIGTVPFKNILRKHGNYEGFLEAYNIEEDDWHYKTRGKDTNSKYGFRKDLKDRGIKNGNRTYGTFIDGLSNYYILAKNSSNNSFTIYYIDEQTKASGRWRKVSLNDTPAMFTAHEEFLKDRKKNWWDPFNISFTGNNASIDASVENIVFATEKKIYSVNWTFGSMDFKWRQRDKCPWAADSADVKLRRDMTIISPAKKDGQEGYCYQQLIDPALIEGEKSMEHVPLPDNFTHQWFFISKKDFTLYDSTLKFGDKINKNLSEIKLTTTDNKEIGISKVSEESSTNLKAEIPFEISELKLTAVPVKQNTEVTVKLNGTESNISDLPAFTVGENVIEITVKTLEDYSFKTYTITVTRLKELSKNTNLARITADGIHSSLIKKPSGSVYNVYLPISSVSQNVNFLAESISAKIKINGIEQTYNTSFEFMDLKVGYNTFTIEVTAEYGNVKTYELNLIVDISPPKDVAITKDVDALNVTVTVNSGNTNDNYILYIYPLNKVPGTGEDAAYKYEVKNSNSFTITGWGESKSFKSFRKYKIHVYSAHNNGDQCIRRSEFDVSFPIKGSPSYASSFQWYGQGSCGKGGCSGVTTIPANDVAYARLKTTFKIPENVKSVKIVQNYNYKYYEEFAITPVSYTETLQTKEVNGSTSLSAGFSYPFYRINGILFRSKDQGLDSVTALTTTLTLISYDGDEFTTSIDSTSVPAVKGAGAFWANLTFW